MGELKRQKDQGKAERKRTKEDKDKEHRPLSPPALSHTTRLVQPATIDSLMGMSDEETTPNTLRHRSSDAYMRAVMLSTFLSQLFSLTVWNLSVSCPVDAHVEKMRATYEASIHELHNTAPHLHSRDAHVLVTALSVALALLEIRTWACGGRRLKKKAKNHLRSFAPHIREMLLRRGPLPSHTCVWTLVQFILSQFRGLFQLPTLRGQQDTYNLSFDSRQRLRLFHYVGHSQTHRSRTLWESNLARRLREHTAALRAHQLGTITQTQRHYCYLLM